MNCTHILEYNNGMVVEEDSNLEWVTREYFKLLFSSQGISDATKILISVDKCIMTNMNEHLSQDFTNEEVITALHSMSPLKGVYEGWIE